MSSGFSTSRGTWSMGFPARRIRKYFFMNATASACISRNRARSRVRVTSKPY